MGYAHVIFDIDGTLVDSTGAIREALQMVAQDLRGSRLTPAEMELGLSLPAPQALAAVGLPSDDATVDLWLDHEYELWGDEVGPFPGVPELMGELAARGVAMGAVTSETRDELRRGFATFDVSRHIAHAVCAEDAPAHKPAPDPLLLCLRLMGARADEAIYVGDSVADARCAHAAGVDFALACWRPEPVAEDVPCVARLASPAQLLDLVLG